MYLAIVLTPESQEALKQLIPEFALKWTAYCHHCTITMGSNKKKKYDYSPGDIVTMNVTHIGFSDTNVAAAVTVPRPIKNRIPHVTMSVNREAGGKPFFSNKIEKWVSLEEGHTFALEGVVELCE